ncbi:MAG: hypothetical protein WCX48_02385 [Bacteroidales bacterium]
MNLQIHRIILSPSGQIVTVKIGLPCVYLIDIDIEACQIEHLILKFQKGMN